MKIDLTQAHDVNGAFKSIDWSAIKTKYQGDAAANYAFSVLTGKRVAGYMIKLACFRFLRDLQRQGQPNFPYHYDRKKVRQFMIFASICPEGESKKLVQLEPFQKFAFSQMVGWLDNHGIKRFTNVDLSMGRHNGKTYMMGLLMSYTFFIESIGKDNQDYLVSSINAKQTSKLMGYVKKTISAVAQRAPFDKYAAEVGINSKSLASSSDTIRMAKNNNRIVSITYNAGSYDGFHFHLAVGDEFGQVADRQGVSDITTGQSGAGNWQFVRISTAYDDPMVPMHQDEQRMKEKMERDFDRSYGENTLTLVWEQDDTSDVFKPETWYKSNPLAERVPKLMDDLKKAYSSAKVTDSVEKFENKSLNIWLQQSKASFLKLGDVENAVNDDFKIDGREVFIGFDYSMFSDNTAIGFIYPFDNGKFRLEQHSFIPWQHAGNIEIKENQDGIAYRQYPQYCTITAHPQGIINPEQIYKWLLNYVDEHNLKVQFFGYDRYGSYQVKNITESLNVNTDWNIMDIQQRTSALANPTKFLQELFVTQKASIPDDPVLQKALLNAVVKADKIGIQVDKDRATLKIDVVDALIDALFQAMYYFDENSDLNNKAAMVDRMTEQQVLDWFNNPDSGLLGGDSSD